MNNERDAQAPGTLRDILLFQYDIARQLLEYNLEGLTDAECLWRPHGTGLHVSEKNGTWYADWPETESYDIGPPSIAWVTWHIIFWWSMVFDHSFGGGSLDHASVAWPGSAAAATDAIRQLKTRWLAVLDGLSDSDLQATQSVRWPFEGRSFGELCAWLNLELMKNATEIGTGRFLYATRPEREN